MLPPLRTKLAGIEGSGDAVVRRQGSLKNTESAPGMIIGSDQQDAAGVGALQAAGHISSLVPSGASVNRTEGNCAGLRQPFDKFPRNLQLVPLVNLGLRGNIEDQPRCVTLVEQL